MTRAAKLVSFAALLCPAAFAQASPEWTSLFDGKTIQGWRESKFRDGGRVTVENGAIVLGAGSPLTGITYSGAFPKINYEIRFEAKRIAGGDFFASLTFPVNDSFCTWVLGGWGGDIVGLSNIDGWDASDNETRSYVTFEPNVWYRFRLQVTPERIMAWIDEKPIVNVEIQGRAIDLRFGDIRFSAPLGFASYNTRGAVRGIDYRLLKTGNK
jgi:3-keto-disaccharide hydrolase